MADTVRRTSSSKIVRDSKLRHVFGEESKVKYDDLRLSNKMTESNAIKVNPNFVATAWDSGGGGALAVIPLARTGRLPRDIPLITGHTGAVHDFDFNPFNDWLLASSSEDLTVKIWQIPEEGFKAHQKEPLVDLTGHGKKVSFCCWNPTADNIIASAAFDQTVKIWNVEEGGQVFEKELKDQAWSLKWNWNGSLLATTLKDKSMYIIDPRTDKDALTQQIHEGSKGSKVEWINNPGSADDCNKIVTTGFSTQAERQLCLWDIRKLGVGAEPLIMHVLDQGTGALYPFFDPGNSMLYIAGKGDGNVRYFELTDEEPCLHFISQYGTTKAQKGFCFMPKRGVDPMKREIARGYKLENATISSMSFIVPRKADCFQEDLFPDGPSGVAGMSATDWTAGKECPPVPTMPLDPAKRGTGVNKPTATAVVSVKDLKEQLAKANETISEQAKEIEALKAEVAKLKG